MIPEAVSIIPGMTVRHDPEGGLLYHVDVVALDTDGYEAIHALNGLKRISYTQLEDGSFPAGSLWNKGEEQFRANFTTIDYPLGTNKTEHL